MKIRDSNYNEKIYFDTINDINKIIPASNPELLIMHYNISSIKKNFLELESRINSLKNKPDIIICTEAWLNDTVYFIDMKGYNHFFNDSRINKSDGTISYIRSY